MSSSFSANAGSLLILKVSTRCGFNPWARQMRRTLASLMPTAAAMVRVLQCVALAGCWRVVRVTTRLVKRVPMVGLRPGHGARAPVRGVGRLLACGQSHDAFGQARADGGLATGPVRVFLQPRH